MAEQSDDAWKPFRLTWTHLRAVSFQPKHTREIESHRQQREEPHRQQKEEPHRQQDDLDGEEDCGAKVMTAPVKPTQAMIDEHEVHHLPCRSWCSFCVRGRATSVGHFTVEHDDEQITLLAIDYGIFGGAAFLAIKDRHTKALWSNMVPSKVWNPACMEATCF